MTRRSEAAARIGSVIAGKYRLNRLIGVGGIGAVYAAIHHFTGRHVAVKLLDRNVSEHDGYAARFLREARAASDIGHPSICDVLDAGQELDGRLYLVLELLEGRDLGEAIEARDLRLEEIVEIGAQLSEGLAAAHDRGIVHRDIKPENIFLTWDEHGELNVKLLDFGVAKNLKKGPQLFNTEHGAVVGTPYYMSPEQAAGDEVDSRADLWSAGAVLFHAITGAPPFDEDSYNKLIARLMNDEPPRLADVRKDVPEWLMTIVDGALKRRLDERWQSARTMAENLRQRGEGPLDLDWDAHEDATLRTESPFDAIEDERPAFEMLTSAEGAPPNIEVELDEDLLGTLDPVSGGPTNRTKAAARMHAKKMSSGKDERQGALFLGAVVGAAVTGLILLSVGLVLYLVLGR